MSLLLRVMCFGVYSKCVLDFILWPLFVRVICVRAFLYFKFFTIFSPTTCVERAKEWKLNTVQSESISTRFIFCTNYGAENVYGRFVFLIWQTELILLWRRHRKKMNLVLILSDCTVCIKMKAENKMCKRYLTLAASSCSDKTHSIYILNGSTEFAGLFHDYLLFLILRLTSSFSSSSSSFFLLEHLWFDAISHSSLHHFCFVCVHFHATLNLALSFCDSQWESLWYIYYVSLFLYRPLTQFQCSMFTMSFTTYFLCKYIFSGVW